MSEHPRAGVARVPALAGTAMHGPDTIPTRSDDAVSDDEPLVASGEGRDKGRGKDRGEGRGKDWRWWHLERTDPTAADRLAAHGVPPQAVEALLDVAVRPRLIRAPDGLVLILRADAGGETLASLRLWIDGSGLASVSREAMPALERCTSLPPSPDADTRDLGTLLTDLIECVVDGVTPRVEALAAEADALEDAVLAMSDGGPPSVAIADRLTRLRRHLVGLSGKLDAQHEALAALSRLAERDGALPDGLALDADARLDLAESVEQCRHDAGRTEQLRERALILRDELERRADERTARHGFALSVAAAVFLPATFITGLLGINVGGVPGAGHPGAFWIVAAICAGVAAASVAFLMWRRWL